jgi:hypothetical protein
MSLINKVTALLTLSVASMLWTAQGFHTLLPTSTSSSSSQRSTAISPLYYVFEQKPGESDMEFISRITSQSSVEEAAAAINNDDKEEPPKPKGKYQRIEEWEQHNNEKGNMSWEQKVQFDGQRLGNQVRQDSILRKYLKSW